MEKHRGRQYPGKGKDRESNTPIRKRSDRATPRQRPGIFREEKVKRMKRTWKKLAALASAAILTLGMATTAFAEDGGVMKEVQLHPTLSR
ncbi:MAG: hypothetical protein LIO99_13260 [Clostridiales bacterium]|nr:hypothetical protein [Clostridiales bacterium]